MLKLIKLEWKKNRIGTYIRNAAILAAILGLFLFAFAFLGIANDPDLGVPDAAPGNTSISAPIELFTNMSFLFLYGCIAAFSSFLTSDFPVDYHMGLPGFYTQLLAKSAVTVTMGFVSLAAAFFSVFRAERKDLL